LYFLSGDRGLYVTEPALAAVTSARTLAQGADAVDGANHIYGADPGLCTEHFFARLDDR
jgi:hypothetical protein